MDDNRYKKCVSTEEIYAILEGEASKETCDLFAEHIKTCEKCKQEYENIKILQNALKNCTSDPSADFAKNTMAKLKAVKRNPFIRITGNPAFKSITAAAACLLIVFVVCSRNGLFNTAGNIANEFDLTNQISRTDDITEDYSQYAVNAVSERDESDAIDAEDNNAGSQGSSSAAEHSVVEEPTTITDDLAEAQDPVAPQEPAQVAPVAPVAPMAPEPAPVEPAVQPNSPTSDAGGDPFTDTTSKSDPVAPTPAPKPTPDSSSTDYSYYENLPEIPTTICPEGPVPVEPPAVVVTPPTASDAFSADPEIPDYVYVPTPVVSDAIVTEALYDHETLLVDIYDPITDKYIYLTRWEGDSAVSQKTWIETAYCGEPKGEIVLPEDNTTEEDIIVVDPSEAIVPVVPTEPEPPSPERIVDGMYIIDDVLSDGSFVLYWFSDECYYRLVLPIEYKDGNETRFKELNLLPNPLI